MVLSVIRLNMQISVIYPSNLKMQDSECLQSASFKENVGRNGLPISMAFDAERRRLKHSRRASSLNSETVLEILAETAS
ncbi:hypothetical protein BSQ33_14145 [Vibrio gazogenes]|uniref:Uncharacterized protein n=1 Tax=Vibrio gazogenes TaxID=687 RepID=A0A1Z2SHZ2_VIBGA|nr:hypothetical protein BSQ33_14145 [Vibrio gazogenes]